MTGKVQVTELDFDDIKTNLKTYMKGQTEFSDYNFEEESKDNQNRSGT